MTIALPAVGLSRSAIKLRQAWIMLVAAGLVGCTTGPDFKRPAPPVVQSYTAGKLPVAFASSPTALGDAQGAVQAPSDHIWWRQFGSRKLDDLIGQALQSNPTLDAAQATLRQAEETYAAQAGTTLYPVANAQLGLQRQRISPAQQGQLGPERTFSLYNASVGVSYNLDLAGGNRRALEALAAQADYQRYQLKGARLTVAANIVTTAITQAQLAGQIAASEAILAAQASQLDLTRQRLALGNASEPDVLALQTQVEQTRASIVPLRNRLEQTNHLLAILAGLPPAATGLPHFILTDFHLPRQLPLSVPSELVRQRPDIRASEALLHVASAQYGVAVSRLYPQITLSGSLGSQALTTAGLFGPGSLVWGLAGQLAQPLFNAGLRPAARGAEAGFDAAAANYKATVLQALRNVADVLRALDDDAQYLQAQSAANIASQQSLELVQRQYRLGAANYVQLLVAQQQAQQTRINLIAAQAQRLADSAAFYQAMGNGPA
ncbi:efflux transporter outer membrane subunit [Thiomonas sp. FB-Cd]|uniref:efflux transporter outer membrane subunit n=1 Tax=Thiomonas sp. FB-Cd TaxID=1158292 RepID=UPI0006899651|nr:efflux transporter outer membrane subunit [Thiomonas sp. FB-Cd]